MAALDKRWVGTTAVPTLATNWAPINLTKPVYKWTQSPAKAEEFYLELVGGGDPGISAPGAVYINSASATEGTVGALTAGQWDYGDNDTLGYSTVYVRITGDGDPDAQVIGYVQMYQIPVATDHVRIPAGSGAMNGVDWTGIAIGDFVVEDGHILAIGSAAQPLMIDPNRFEFSGGGVSHIYSIGAIAHDVRKTATAVRGTAGLYLTGTGISILTVLSGTVGVAMLHGQTSVATTVRLNGPSAVVYLGKGVTNTTTHVINGKLYQNCAGTTANIFGGYFQTEEAGAITDINADGAAKLVLNSTGTVGTLTMAVSYTGVVDTLQSAEASTFSSVVQNGGEFWVDLSVKTVTAHTTPRTTPQKIKVSAA